MRRPLARRHRRRRTSLGAALLTLAVVALVLVAVLAGAGGTQRAAGQIAPGEPTPQSDASVPAQRVTIFGASPVEAANETWGIGDSNQGNGGSSATIVRYSSSGWTIGASLLNHAGEPLSGFAPASSTSGDTYPLAGEMTPDGSGALLGASQGGANEMLLVRDPGGSFQQTTPLPAPEAGEHALLQLEEKLYGGLRAPLLAALEEANGHAGALVVPVRSGGGTSDDGVLHWDGSSWTREPIEIPTAAKAGFHVLAIGASSPTNAWLLAELSSEAYPSGAVALFRRRLGESGETTRWQPVALKAGATPHEAFPLTVPLEGGGQAPFTVPGEGDPPTVRAQLLTVTSAGVWVDGERSDTSSSATLFFKPEALEGEEDWGRVSGSWCVAGAGEACQHELPEALPTGPSRSYAWAQPAGGEGFGQRVVSGLPDGVSLRLDGSTFSRVLALGGGVPPNDVGGTYGAAFSEPREGWLGAEQLPVHLTLNPVPSRLTPYPVSFRHALVAIAPEPGAPVGALSSEALAVGDQGEIARYEPGNGWMPESLLNGGGRRVTPRLRAVAWPTAKRAYAVGDEGQMWLWRGETGLWEQDPATPFNFDGNLLGIAFDPSNPTRGYAVGQQGVLLSYGKTWTQEALPPGLAGANFTSIAFAGSEAIVAYRILPKQGVNQYVGGLLVNNGRGWEIDQQAAAAMGSSVPWAVAGLPDGGAAFATGEASGQGGGATVFERQATGGQWQATPTPLPGFAEPGSLALFREAGELRAIASGSVPDTFAAENEAAPPPGLPPVRIAPYPLNAGSGFLLRQTASGWSDEEHEGNDVAQPRGSYSFFDTVYQPDPISAVLTDSTGTQGWAIGGFVDTADGEGQLDTADVERYPADGVAPPGISTSTIAPASAETALFAIGGNAQCAAPCADLANARIGPDVWLSAALGRASQIAGVRSFLYTGSRVTTGETAGPATLAIPYARELERYAQVLSSSPLPARAAASPTDLDPQSECSFEQIFKPLLLPNAGESFGGTCSSAPQTAYYAFDSSGSPGQTVRVIVLDDTRDVEAAQLNWLSGELAAAAGRGVATIVIGSADLNAQIAKGDSAATSVAQVLSSNQAPASAYFYDSPEKNVTGVLHVGGEPVPTFGSGTLGYVDFTAEHSGSFVGASGFLLAEVSPSKVPGGGRRFAVSAQLIPNVGELALEAQQGTLLRRSQVASFAALARRARAGNRSQNEPIAPDTDPYIPIPSLCAASCPEGLLPKYEFTSSNTRVGGFVMRNEASTEANAVLLDSHGNPIEDETGQSGLFCAYNPGTTTVTVKAGGLASSLPVTVQAGSVRRPCGTVPAGVEPVKSEAASAVPPPAPAPTPASAAPATSPAPVPVPASPPSVAPASPPSPHAAALPSPFFVTAAPAASLPAFVPLPVPTPARPTPPSGTSAVTSPVEAAEKEEEHEEAPESVSNSAVAYRAPEHEPAPYYVLGIVALAAFAGASTRRRMRRGRSDVRVAPATLNTIRTQRRYEDERRRP